MKKISKVGIFTSGGDSPGMNAAIRAIVIAAQKKQIAVTGIIKGFEGMIDGNFQDLTSKDVSNIVHRGGTILKSARSKRFMEEASRKQALENLKKNKIDGLIAIGGDGTFRGLLALAEISDIPVMGIPGTIDNDLSGTDFTLGFDTAVNNALEAIDKIRDTADSHERIFIVEVMGRDAGYIAINSGLAGGAAGILIPEMGEDTNKLVDRIQKGWKDEQSSLIIVVCEGDETGAEQVAKLLKGMDENFDIRITVLGHVQRGGNPTYRDRILGASLGIAALDALLEGQSGKMAGVIKNEIVFTTFDKVIKQHTIDKNMLELMELLT